MPELDSLHPLLIHFPIALYGVGLFFDLSGSLLHNEGLAKAGWWNMAAAQFFAVFTVISGFWADALVGHMDQPFPIFSTHGSLQLLALVLLTALFIIRSWRKSHLPRTPRGLILYLLVQAMSVGFLFYGAHLGAKLANRI
ncbi:MAG: DUF2231 domain-containing protein [FCB group bacterium]|nr:DUF2231 domain-containing protein [FCB group bacterium]